MADPSYRPVRGVSTISPGVTFGVTNFKSIASVQLPPTRLTVLAGSNSSGKSSLLQASLFFAQSAREPAPVINGDLVRLGEPKDVIRDGTSDLVLEVGFEERASETEARFLSFQLTLRATDQGLRPSRVTFCVDGDSHMEASGDDCPAELKKRLLDQETPLRVHGPSALQLPEEAYLTVIGTRPGRLIYRAAADDYRRYFNELLEQIPVRQFLFDELMRSVITRRPENQVPAPLRPLWAELRHGRPLRREWADLGEEQAEAFFQLFFETENPGGWASEPIALNSLGTGLLGVSSLSYQRTQGGAVQVAVSRLSEASKKIESFGSRLVYLGPLRDDPRVAYPLGHTISNLPVGEKGEFTAAYLEANRDKWVQFVSPEGRRTGRKLQEAVSMWCRHLGIADDVDVQSRGKLGHQLELEVGGRRRDPTAIGVGASQLLPVVVLVLGADRGRLVLLEQPELHLHPKVQSRLGDFLSSARPDIRLLVETHSEYLITRLRRRVAEGVLNPDDLAVLFARQHISEHVYEEEGEEGTEREVFSEFRRLSLDEQGDFSAWPEDFFDALDDDTVHLAQAVMKRIDETL